MLPSCLVHANVACAYYSLASYPGHVMLLSSRSAWLTIAILLHHDCSDYNDHQERLNCKCIYKQLVLLLCTEDEVLELLCALDTSKANGPLPKC